MKKRMVTFLIIATDAEKRKTYRMEQVQKLQIHPLDVTTITQETSEKTTQSIGIDTVKYIKQKIFLKPFKGTKKMLVIEDAQLLTTEAQNALLKLLEEPPDHTIIFIETTTKEALLPTILSRCQIIELVETQNLASLRIFCQTTIQKKVK